MISRMEAMVGRLVKIGDAWQRCKGSGNHEKVRLLNLYKRNRDDQTDLERGHLSNKRLKTSCRTLPTVKQEHGQHPQQDHNLDSEMHTQADASPSPVTRAVSLKRGKKHAMLDVQVTYGDTFLEGYYRSAEITHQNHQARKKPKYTHKDQTNPAKDRIQHSLMEGEPAEYLAVNCPLLQGEIKASKGIGRIAMGRSRSSSMIVQSEEKVSDSFVDDGAMKKLGLKIGYPSGSQEDHQPVNSENSNQVKTYKKDYSHLVDRGTSNDTQPAEAYSFKANQRGKISKPGYSYGMKSTFNKGQMPHLTDKLQASSLEMCATNLKKVVDLDYSLQHTDYLHQYDNGIMDEDEDKVNCSSRVADDYTKSRKSVKRSRKYADNAIMSDPENSNVRLVACKTGPSKWKGRSNMSSFPKTSLETRDPLCENLTDPPTPWSPSEKETDADRQARLLRLMSNAIDLLKSSHFYRRFLSRLRKPAIQDGLARVLASEPVLQMVVYGIGRIESNDGPRYQLALALQLRHDLGRPIASIEVFDPVLSATECAVIEALGCKVLRQNERGFRSVATPTLFFMPHCEAPLYDNVLHANWSPAALNRIMVLGNSFRKYAQYIQENTDHVLGVRKYATEVKMDKQKKLGSSVIIGGVKGVITWSAVNSLTEPEEEDDDDSDADDNDDELFLCAFGSLSWHFFELADKTDMNIVPIENDKTLGSE